jgi:hypothetical protein
VLRMRPFGGALGTGVGGELEVVGFWRGIESGRTECRERGKECWKIISSQLFAGRGSGASTPSAASSSKTNETKFPTKTPTDACIKLRGMARRPSRLGFNFCLYAYALFMILPFRHSNS